MTAEAAERNHRMLLERAGGATLRELGEEHGVSPQAIHAIVVREGRRHIEKLVLDLWGAQKKGQLLMLAVPADVGDDQRLAIGYLHWVLSELPEYGVEPRVRYRPALGGGCVFAIEDAKFQPVTTGEAR